jgi:prepilin-type N-terminal cleavage/methylation domain-containing protein
MKNRSRKPRSRARAGFSLAELLVAVVLLGIVGGAITRLLVDQMRFFDTVQVSRGARSAARNSMNVMFSELRMTHRISAVAADNKSISVDVPYRLGVHCGTAANVSSVSMLPGDSVTLALSSFGGYAYRNPATGLYVSTESAIAPTSLGVAGAVCTAAFVNTVTINGRTGEVFQISGSTIPATTAAGVPVLFYQRVTYSFQASTLFPGKVGLYRAVNGGTAEELTGPFASSARFYYYRASDDQPQATAPATAEIVGIAIALTTEGARKPAGRTTDMKNQMMTAIFFKNSR